MCCRPCGNVSLYFSKQNFTSNVKVHGVPLFLIHIEMTCYFGENNHYDEAFRSVGMVKLYIFFIV